MKSKISVTCGCPSLPFFNDRDHEYPIKIYRQESNLFLLMQIWQKNIVDFKMMQCYKYKYI